MHTKRNAFKAAFPATLPILAGFLFLGMSYGILMRVSGFEFWYPILMSVVIFGGSLEFVAVSMLASPFAPVSTLLMTLMIQARHIFYGIAMLDKYKGMGWKKFYLIYGMCDESFSVNCSAEIRENIDRGWYMFFVTLLNQSYWVLGATLGSLAVEIVSFNTEGLDFVMTAMFVVIFTEQLLKEKNHISAVIGTVCSVFCLLIFGAEKFMIPSMLLILFFLTVFKKKLDKEEVQ